MRDPDRIDEMVEALRQTWKAFPDMRFGQLIENAAGTRVEGSLFYIEDEQMLEHVRRYLAEAPQRS